MTEPRYSLWTARADPEALRGLVIPAQVSFSAGALARARRRLERRFAPYGVQVTAQHLQQPVP